MSRAPALADRVGTAIGVVAVLACHNRRELSLASLKALHASAAQAAVPLEVVLVDDGSVDGTADAVRAAFPQVQVMVGDGNLYWCRAMHQGTALALARTPMSHLLWLNDDVLLDAGAIAHLLQQAQRLRVSTGTTVIVVGATCDAQGRCSYGGGVSFGGWRRLRYRPVGGGADAERCDVFNGNCVLLPRDVLERLGNLDPAFEHAMGDTDFALRAGAAGVPIFVAPGYVARCERNPIAGTADDPALSRRERLRALLSRKGLPWRSWWRFTRRHGGLLWPLRFAWPYLRVAIGPKPR